MRPTHLAPAVLALTATAAALPAAGFFDADDGLPYFPTIKKRQDDKIGHMNNDDKDPMSDSFKREAGFFDAEDGLPYFPSIKKRQDTIPTMRESSEDAVTDPENEMLDLIGAEQIDESIGAAKGEEDYRSVAGPDNELLALVGAEHIDSAIGATMAEEDDRSVPDFDNEKLEVEDQVDTDEWIGPERRDAQDGVPSVITIPSKLDGFILNTAVKREIEGYERDHGYGLTDSDGVWELPPIPTEAPSSAGRVQLGWVAWVVPVLAAAFIV